MPKSREQNRLGTPPRTTSRGIRLRMSEPPESRKGEGMGVTGNQWAVEGACRSNDPDELFVQGAAQNRAKVVCLACPVRMECLADALDNRIEFGVWGGMTERERRALLRRRPNIRSWRRLLETARSEQARSERARSERARSEQGRSEQGRSEPAQPEQDRSEQGRSERARSIDLLDDTASAQSG